MSASTSMAWEGMNEARAVLQSLVARGDDMTQLMQNIASYGVSSTQSRIADEKRSPNGAPWASYKDPKYASRKAARSSGGLLEHSGMLIQSMTSNATRTNAGWGSNREYAARQQFGGGGVIARPYLGISNENSRVLIDLVKSYYANNT